MKIINSSDIIDNWTRLEVLLELKLSGPAKKLPET